MSDEAGEPALRYRLLAGSADGESGGCLLVRVAGERHRPRAGPRSMGVPAESGRLSVVMTRAAANLMPALAARLRQWVPDRWDSIRLVSSRSGAPDSSGTPAGQQLCDCLGVEVLAPEADLVFVPGGSLFVVDRHTGGARPGWVRFRPYRSPKPAGRRVPAPDWEPDLATFADPGIGGAVVEEIPAGLWAHLPDAGASPDTAPEGVPAATVLAPVVAPVVAPVGDSPPERTGTPVASAQPDGADLAFAVPVHRKTMALLVSRPGEAGLPTATVEKLLTALPDPLRECLAVVPYGGSPVSDGHLGPVVSRAAGRTVRVRNGLPLHLPGKGPQVVAVGSDGVPTWRPFARELVWRPHGGSHIVTWTAPVDHLLPVAHGQLAIDERWIVEVIEAGLWIRETEAGDPGGLVRGLPLDPRHCCVVIGAPATSQLAPPRGPIVKLLRRLPVDARRRVRVLVPWGAGEWVVRAATRSYAQALGGTRVWLLRPDGSVQPGSRAPGRRAAYR